jgi:hypothetical protein
VKEELRTWFGLQFGCRNLFSKANNVDRPKQLNLVMETPAVKRRLRATLDYQRERILLECPRLTEQKPKVVEVKSTGFNRLEWRNIDEGLSLLHSGTGRESIDAALASLLREFPADEIEFGAFYRDASPKRRWEEIELEPDEDRREYLIQEICEYGATFDDVWSGREKGLPPDLPPAFEGYYKRLRKEEERARELRKRIEEGARRQEEKRREREKLRKEQERLGNLARKHAVSAVASIAGSQSAAPIPPVPLAFEIPSLRVQETMLPAGDLKRFLLREKAALWWVSNQTDDLLALPYCRIERMEYQLRTALRVVGPLRGRALLSDEVGLGKTVEAGLVLKEYLVRGLVKRFLVLTVPSLVDQWEDELDEKFAIRTATTNQPGFRNDAAGFWSGHQGIVASLHTAKQPAHLAAIQQVNWDLLIVDEAHYLRNRTSVAWNAVNAIPRQFLLLLTATPVQNSLEELYNLVTLLQPGQLPSPREFNQRFLDRENPHKPKEPEELRRLLGQVMIRNTRANAGINLPSRRAETVLFESEAGERKRWQEYETQLRDALHLLNPSQASLWGRLLLQAAGSSPQAWKAALQSFPRKDLAAAWVQWDPFDSGWRKKCQLVLPLTQSENGVVIFSQFLETQAALASALQAAGVPVFVINGQTPPPQRQPITEQFRKEGGALLLTHSGTEGRNLQFCHRLVNFDLPWNPMEIEQRIGRVHRIGQQHTVRIYNFVQAGSLQEHLLRILQEKLNLFELVVGETGLILGDKFSSDEFAEEVFRRWRESQGRVGESFAELGEELAAARGVYQEVKDLDQSLFSRDYELL